jgi:hypothetical protein
MIDWTSVDDELPTVKERTRYLVTMRVGSMSPKEIVTIVHFVPHPPFNGGRFMEGDLQKVLYWAEVPLPAKGEPHD